MSGDRYETVAVYNLARRYEVAQPDQPVPDLAALAKCFFRLLRLLSANSSLPALCCRYHLQRVQPASVFALVCPESANLVSMDARSTDRLPNQPRPLLAV